MQLDKTTSSPTGQRSAFPITLTERQQLIVRIEYRNLRDETSCVGLFWIEDGIRRLYFGLNYSVFKYALVNGYRLWGIYPDPGLPPYPVSSFEDYKNFSDAALRLELYGPGTWQDVLKRYDLSYLRSEVTAKIYESTDRSKLIWKI